MTKLPMEVYPPASLRKVFVDDIGLGFALRWAGGAKKASAVRAVKLGKRNMAVGSQLWVGPAACVNSSCTIP